MSTPHQCPVCQGSGRLFAALQTGTAETLDCHACGGRGVVWSPEEPKPCEPEPTRFLGTNVWTGDVLEAEEAVSG